MTQQQYFKVIERQLQQINDRIDTKILKGDSYTTESKKHKELVQKLRAYNRQSSIFGRLFTTVFQ